MPILTKEQIENGYFHGIAGFPPLNSSDDRTNFACEVREYKGQKKLCIGCTQLDGHGYSEYRKKRIPIEWIDFLKTNTTAFKALHFCSHTSQALFDAACCQEGLEELFFKWGTYKDLSALENLPNLKYLWIGAGASVQDIMVLGEMRNLIVLCVENFKRIENYSPLASLNNIEQLIIRGPILGNTYIKDYEFLREMKSLVSVWFPNTKTRRRYTHDELKDLSSAMPNLQFLHNSHFY